MRDPHYGQISYTRRQIINLHRMFFADFSVNSQPILASTHFTAKKTHHTIIMVGLWTYNQSGVTEQLIMRDPHYDQMCFQSVKTLGALHS